MTGHSLAWPVGCKPLERQADLDFWLTLDADLVGARQENGWWIPSEVDYVLDRWGIETEANREVARQMLAQIASGRISGQFDDEGPTGDEGDE